MAGDYVDKNILTRFLELSATRGSKPNDWVQGSCHHISLHGSAIGQPPTYLDDQIVRRVVAVIDGKAYRDRVLAADDLVALVEE